MWKPTKHGIYRLGDAVVAFAPRGYRSMTCINGMGAHTEITTTGIFDYVGQQEVVPDGAWSLIGPGWQDGAPTVEQLGRWSRWAIVTVGGDLVIGSWSAHVTLAGTLLDVVTSNGRKIDTDAIARSAPVQPVPGEVLWVPLEVVK